MTTGIVALTRQRKWYIVFHSDSDTIALKQLLKTAHLNPRLNTVMQWRNQANTEPRAGIPWNIASTSPCVRVNTHDLLGVLWGRATLPKSHQQVQTMHRNRITSPTSYLYHLPADISDDLDLTRGCKDNNMTKDSFDHKEWNVMIEGLLNAVTGTEFLDPELYRTFRQVVIGEPRRCAYLCDWWIPSDQDLPLTRLPYCYLFKGKFSPSSDADGLFWKPSRSSMRIGKNLYRRYHYAVYMGTRLRRQVSSFVDLMSSTCWPEKTSFLQNQEGLWNFIEYRTGSPAAHTIINEVYTPSGQDFSRLVDLVPIEWSQKSTHIVSPPVPLPSPDHSPLSQKRKRTTEIIDDPFSRPLEGDYYTVDVRTGNVLYSSTGDFPFWNIFAPTPTTTVMDFGYDNIFNGVWIK